MKENLKCFKKNMDEMKKVLKNETYLVATKKG